MRNGYQWIISWSAMFILELKPANLLTFHDHCYVYPKQDEKGIASRAYIKTWANNMPMLVSDRSS